MSRSELWVVATHLENTVGAGEVRRQFDCEVVSAGPTVSQGEGWAVWLEDSQEVGVKTLLGWVPGPGGRAHWEPEVTSMVCCDLHSDLDLLTRPVCGHNLPSGKLSAHLVFPGSIVRVSTQSTPPSVDFPLDSDASTEPLIVLVVFGRIKAVPPHGGSRWRLD